MVGPRGPLWCLVSEVEGITINKVPENTREILHNVNKNIKIMVDNGTYPLYNIPILNEMLLN